MLRRMSVGAKILATLVVPIVVLLGAAGFISAQAIADQRAAAQTEALFEALGLGDTAGRMLGAERGMTLAGGPGGAVTPQLANARQKTDNAFADWSEAFESLDVSALDPQVKESMDAAVAATEKLPAIRESFDAGKMQSVDALTEFDAIVNAALAVPETLADATTDREFARYMDAYVSLNELLGQLALEGSVGAMVIGVDGDPDPALTTLASTTFSQGNVLAANANRAVQALDIGESVELVGNEYGQVRRAMVTSSPENLVSVKPTTWSNMSKDAMDEVSRVRETVRVETDAKAKEDAASAQQRMYLTVGAAGIAVVFSLAFGWYVARMISRPLHQLTEAAQEIRDELPSVVEHALMPGEQSGMTFEPILVGARYDEVGRLAAAFNDVNATTLQIARDQAQLRGSIAEMFVNVARRDQVLLNRQLAFLDDLERAEQDPAALSNYFRLDHLATRMRRNAESLLVLAGIDSGRRVRQPMALDDVVRTASSEIELYDRVRLDLSINPALLGHNALNTAHLIAELLENATMFSEPHTPVEVSAAYDGQFVRVAVRDHGLGMTPSEVDEANRRVASRSATEVVGAQRLGLYVVGRLADRLGARVGFVVGRDGPGTEAVVDLPITLFAADAAAQISPTVPALEPVAHRPQTAASAEPAPAFGLPVEPEPPVVEAVDLGALTDGTTATGMPKRRTSRAIEHTLAPPSATVSQNPQTGAIVLPPLATPSLPLTMSMSEEAWAPPEDITVPGRALPSRHRPVTDGAEHAEGTLPVFADGATEAEELPVLDVGSRSALFSKFRSMGDLGTGSSDEASPVELAPLPAASATDISVPSVTEPAAGDVWSPTFEIDESALAVRPAPETAEDDVVALDAAHGAPMPIPVPMPVLGEPAAVEQPLRSQFTEEPQATFPDAGQDDSWLSALTGETVMLRSQPSAELPSTYEPTAPALDPELPPSSYEPEPVSMAQVPFAPPAPMSPTPSVGEPQGQHVPEHLGEPTGGQTTDSLPAFDTLMSDLPSRRAGRDDSSARRGLFGRRQRPATPVPDQSFAPAMPLVGPGAPGTEPFVAPPVPEVPVPEVQAPTAPEAHAYYPEPTVFEEARHFAPAPAPGSMPPAFEVPVDEPHWPVSSPALNDVNPGLDSLPAFPGRHAEAMDVSEYGYPAHDAEMDDTATAVGESLSEFGPPSPLTRRQVSAPVEQESLYGGDTVEARSEWMASAVLYEEMASLIRGSGESVLESPASDVYQPIRMDVPETPQLSRRPMEANDGYIDRFTARIDRDPEQLRARLAAFQSATVRGRSDAQDEAETGRVPGQVPDQAPHSR